MSKSLWDCNIVLYRYSTYNNKRRINTGFCLIIFKNIKLCKSLNQKWHKETEHNIQTLFIKMWKGLSTASTGSFSSYWSSSYAPGKTAQY